ncbi:hypothetical protein ABE28_019035 [Peribacillus muralis]|uniref:Uncharacterized protein n=1 Tax=Peribacillus muralis TaxID=264697 RepID=A0A1B3XTD0_9BACI|nr:hypothetical protein [Peribacillus muralis]AOH56467.1 hypothetical protein ABE28_019035 [Peribacillus muralis]
MNKRIYWIVWTFALIGITYFAGLWSLWSTFAAPEGSTFVTMIIYIVLNAGIIQLLIAMIWQKWRFFWMGLSFVIIQFICLILGGDMPILLAALAGSVVLTIIQLRNDRTNP